MRLNKMIQFMVSTTLCIGVIIGCEGLNSRINSTESRHSELNKKVIAFVQVGSESGWRTAETESIKSISTLDPSFELRFFDGQKKQDNQIKAMRSFIAQKVDLIALDPVIEIGWGEVLQEAKDNKIPVIIVDRKVIVNDESLYKCFLGSDMEEEGRKAAQIVIDKFGNDAQINIVEIQGTIGSTAMIGRQRGFNERIKECHNYKIIKSESADFSRAKGKEVMEAFLKSDANNINVLWSHNDDMAIGAIQSMEEYGKVPSKDIFIVSVDGVKDMFEVMAEGKTNAIVECNPLLGPQLLEISKSILNGNDVEKNIKSKEGQFLQNQANVELPNRKY